MIVWPAIVTLVWLLVVAPLLPGIATKTRAWLTGRRGPPLLQLYFDLGKLWRKRCTYSRTTTWMFRVAPLTLLMTTLGAACLLPLDGSHAVLRFSGDFIAFASLLALGRFALVLAGLDTGSSFEGMGASRDVTFATFTEPALLLGFATLALLSGSLSLTGMFGTAPTPAWTAGAGHVGAAQALIATSLFLVLLAETARVPVDDPATHLELTMIHEVIVLDHSGPDLAVILYSGAVKLMVFGALVVGVLIPPAALSGVRAVAALTGGLVLVAALVGVVESATARLRLTRVPQFLVTAAALSALATLLVLLQ
ncbi:MAG: NADH-quinone oxidoreductase subunit H [Gemmatimonadales bacterium]|nr:NADH-quinone oxidoreductase subunit H [Gemmatimonadales bacterium]